MPSEDEQLETEEVEGFSLDAERQAIIDQYLNQAKFDDQGEYKIVKVDEEGNEIVEKDDYRIVKVDDEGKSFDVRLQLWYNTESETGRFISEERMCTLWRIKMNM